MAYPRFERSRLEIRPLAERKHDMTLADVLPLEAETLSEPPAELVKVAEWIVRARSKARPVVLMMGAHVIKQGLSRFVIDLLERGIITHVGFNGACAIHDTELAMIGATTESVAHYISEGQFGLWRETGLVNEGASYAAARDLGFGEGLGDLLLQRDLPHLDVSILAAGKRLGVPVTVHVGIGQDIVHELPNADGAAIGKASYNDFLVFVNTITQLEGGVFLNYGTAVMGPEVYLKALSMARNVARQEGRKITDFCTAVFDLQLLPPNYHTTPPKSEPGYYHRWWKSVLVRTVQDGGESYYVRLDHKLSLPTLRKLVLERLEK